MNESEKDSAFRRLELHEATSSTYHHNKKVITKNNDSSCALAGQTGGAIRLSLIFFCFFSLYEDKEKKGTKRIFSIGLKKEQYQ
jgi:hypothetical protein